MLKSLFSQTRDGMLDLNIARLEHHLKLLEQRQILSEQYPDYKAKLTQRKLQVQDQLQQLLERRSVNNKSRRNIALQKIYSSKL